MFKQVCRLSVQEFLSPHSTGMNNNEAVPNTVPPEALIADRHKEILESSAIPISLAAALGVKSIESSSDLPETALDLAHYAPGLLFPLRDLNGDVAWQIRPDSPPTDKATGRPRKYIVQSNVGSFITVHPPVDSRLADLDNVQTILIVEGTKQCLAAVAWADDDVAPVGLQGCWGWSRNSQPIADFDDIVEGKTVVIAFDADVSTNAMVNAAAKGLRDHLVKCGADSVRWIRTRDVLGDANSPTEGLDDWLASKTEPDRTKALRQAIRSAGKRIPALVQSAKSVTDITADTEDCVLRYDSVHVGDIEHKGEVILGCLPDIVEDVVTIDDLAGDESHQISYKLAVKVKRNDEVLTGTVDVVSEDLRHPRKWLDGVSGGIANRCIEPPDPRTSVKVANFIRSNSSDSIRKIKLMRTGWYLHNGVYVWAHKKGAIGPDGQVDDVSSQLYGLNEYVSLPDPSTFTDDQIRESVRALIGVASHLADPTAWWAIFGGIVSAEAGIPPKGAVMITGRPQSGKTHLAKAATAMLSPSYGPQSAGITMATMDGTTNAVVSSGQGLHHCFVLVDDARSYTDPRKMSEHIDALDALIRRGYGGGSAGKRRMTIAKTADGKIIDRKMDMSSPFIIITSETLPSPVTHRSTVERILGIGVTAESTFLKGETRIVEEDAAAGKYWRANASFIHWLANQIRLAGKNYGGDPLQAWIDHLAALSDHSLSPALRGLSNRRVEEVAGSITLGLLIWRLFLKAVFEHDDPILETPFDGIDKVLIAARDYANVTLGKTTTPHSALLQAIHAGISRNEMYLAGDNPATTNLSLNPHCKCVGTITTLQGFDGKVIGLVPDSVSAVLHDVTTDQVRLALSEIVIKDQKGGTTRPLNVGPNRLRCICIPYSEWPINDG